MWHAPPPRLSRTEFIALVGMVFATVAFSIDAMLPALPDIAAELSPENPNHAQLILTVFVLGMGAGTFIVGPLSDTFGRKPVIVTSAVVYCAGALLAWSAPTLETMLAARLVQGFGAAGPRTVTVAIVRDLYSGRQMARIMSFAMIVFTLVPAAAPLIGALIMAALGWRSIFGAFLVFSLVSVGWLMVRQPETLPPAVRTPFRPAPLRDALFEVLRHPVVRTSIILQSLLFGMLFGTLSQIQSLFGVTFGRAESFPLWFAMIALIAGSASLINATLVVRLGMRRMIRVALIAQIVLSGAMTALLLLCPGSAADDILKFVPFLIWITGIFFMAGLTLGNVNAMGMEPMGHIAGMAASVISALATVLGALLAIPLGLGFDDTPLPLALGLLAMSAIALAVLAWSNHQNV